MLLWKFLDWELRHITPYPSSSFSAPFFFLSGHLWRSIWTFSPLGVILLQMLYSEVTGLTVPVLQEHTWISVLWLKIGWCLVRRHLNHLRNDTEIPLPQRFSRHLFVCVVLPFTTACFMNGNKKILDGHLPVIPRPRFLHPWLSATPCSMNAKKKTSESLSHPELEPFQKCTIPLENLQFHWKYVSLWEGFSEHCGLSPLRGPSAGAISGVQPSSLPGERRSVG